MLLIEEQHLIVTRAEDENANTDGASPYSRSSVAKHNLLEIQNEKHTNSTVRKKKFLKRYNFPPSQLDEDKGN